MVIVLVVYVNRLAVADLSDTLIQGGISLGATMKSADDAAPVYDPFWAQNTIPNKMPKV